MWCMTMVVEDGAWRGVLNGPRAEMLAKAARMRAKGRRARVSGAITLNPDRKPVR